MRRSLCLLVSAALAVSLSSGCASKYGTQKTEVHYYPACYDPIQKLRKEEKSVTDSTVGGSAVGALGGALLGVLVTGKAEGALIGAVAGAAGGAVVGNQLAKNRQIASQNQRMAAYLNDLDGSIANLNIVSASARSSLQCYDRQFKLLVTAIRKKRVTHAEAQRMFAEIRSGTEEASALLGELESEARDMERQYREALASEEQRLRTTQAGPSRTAAHNELRRAQRSCNTLQGGAKKAAAQKAAADSQLKAQQDELAAVLASSQA